MLGDVVGEAGLLALERGLPALKAQHKADFVVVNGENAAGGFGLSADTLNRILAAGADLVTSGNHVFEKRDFWPVLDSDLPVLRPANYPSGVAGKGYLTQRRKDAKVSVINLQGREFMTPIDCPFKTFDRIYDEITNQSLCVFAPLRELILIDFHAESSREKEALAYYLDGRAGIVVGTHTHIQTADEKVLPNGTAYITDLGFTGLKDSILGMDKEACIKRTRDQVLYQMQAASAEGLLQIQGLKVCLEGDGLKAAALERINYLLQ
jgi:metallophosphoesterase (TIGR00282 family)